MRRILYIPIMHGEEDLGTLGAALAQKSAALSGDQRWAMHKATVCQFWASVATSMRSFDPGQLKLYQDGLAAEGEMARRIVQQAAERGSKNYQLVLELLDGGAELRKTEDPGLLLQEHQSLLGSLEQESVGTGRRSSQQYPLQRDRLLAERDSFIAETVNATLQAGELGVLFIGANHNVTPLLAGDIAVETVKDPGQVRAYFEELFVGHDDKRLEELREYLTSPVAC